MAWVGRELKDHQAPTLLPQAGPTTSIFNTNQTAQDPIQPGFEHLQGQGILNLSGHPVPPPHHSHSKELPPDIQPKSSLLQLQTIFCYSLPFQRVDSPPVSQKFTKVLGGDDTMPGIQL